MEDAQGAAQPAKCLVLVTLYPLRESGTMIACAPLAVCAGRTRSGREDRSKPCIPRADELIRWLISSSTRVPSRQARSPDGNLGMGMQIGRWLAHRQTRGACVSTTDTPGGACEGETVSVPQLRRSCWVFLTLARLRDWMAFDRSNRRREPAYTGDAAGNSHNNRDILWRNVQVYQARLEHEAR